MFLRPGEVEQRRAETLLFKQTHVDLQPILQREADLVLAVRQRLVDTRKLKNVLGQGIHVFLRRVARAKRQQQIQIANGLLAAPKRTCRSYVLDRLASFLDMRNDLRSRRFRCINVKPPRRFLEHFDRLQNILFALFAKTGKVAEFPLFCDFLYIGDCPGLEVGPQKRHLLGPERLQLQQIQNRRRIFLQQFFPKRIITRLNDFLKMLHHALSDSRKLFQLFRLLHELLDRFRKSIDEFRRLFVTAVAADDGAVDFQKLRGFAEDAGDLFVVHERDYKARSQRRTRTENPGKGQCPMDALIGRRSI